MTRWSHSSGSGTGTEPTYDHGMPRPWILACLLLAAPVAAAQELVVFAASSLMETFEDVAADFEAEHPGVDVLLAFEGSSTLALQILQGAPADVFASANPEQMQRVVEAGLAAGEPEDFASNRLVVIAAEDSDVRSVDDLAAEGTLVVLGTPEVPVGAYAREALTLLEAERGAGFAAQVLANVVSEEPNVRQAAAKVELGEADASIVYATDAAVLVGVRVFGIPDVPPLTARYPIVALERSARPDLARAFVEHVLSEAGRAALAAHGFQPTE